MKEWIALVDEGIQVTGPLPVKISHNHEGQPALGVPRDAFAVYFDLHAPDLDDPTRAAVIARAFAPTHWPGRAAALEILRAEVLALVAHEIDERFYVGPTRPFDPHA